MNKKNILSLIYFVSILMISCAPNSEVYSGSVIELDFSRVDQIQENEWIEIDGYKFTHYAIPESKKENEYPLPATIIKTDTTENADKIRVNTRTIARRLGLYLNKISEGSNGYNIISPEKIQFEGALVFTKKDSSEIKIRTSADYPGQISLRKR